MASLSAFRSSSWHHYEVTPNQSVSSRSPGCSHRYLPAGRYTYGHPVLSIHQTNIIVCGTGLADYISQEFGRYFIGSDWTPPLVRFWSDFF